MDLDDLHMVEFFFLRRGIVTSIDVSLAQNAVFVVSCDVLIDMLYMLINRLYQHFSIFLFRFERSRCDGPKHVHASRSPGCMGAFPQIGGKN